MTRLVLAAATWILLAASAGWALPHDGPDPLARWLFRAKDLRNGKLVAQIGPDATLRGKPTRVPDSHGESLLLDGRRDRLLVADDLSKVKAQLPTKAMTVSAWASVNSPKRWGGLISVVQDNGNAECGWVLGYDDRHFTFGLASEGADDGDGKMTYLAGKTEYEVGRLYQIVGVYDGETMQLYVNGRLDGSSTVQSGKILYPAKGPVALGAYLDKDEEHLHHGRLREVAVFGVAAKASWVAHEYAHFVELAAADPVLAEDRGPFRYRVAPYLQYVTQTGVTVMWETSRVASSVVHYGESAELGKHVTSKRKGMLHELRITGLEAEKPYFYKVESIAKDGSKLESDVLTFQSANRRESPFAFAVISDTQDNRKVAGIIAKHAFGQRPNFALIPGDLVGEGGKKSDWLDEFFPAMQPLISRVAFFPVLGNHERNARNYYDYVSLPKPEYYYSFRYGNAEFFCLDSNKNVGEGSEQYTWLSRELAKSKATWKFVCYHHPSFSSDENDYGDMWKGKSTHGDLRIRPLTKLYDQHGVDIVWNGHIHSYERTWPLKKGKVDPKGTTYMITGGGGGGLETPGPIKPFFQNNVRRGHHYVMVAIAGKILELKAYDLENRLFDVLKIEKR